MRNFPGIVFTWTQTYREIFKSALVCLVGKGNIVLQKTAPWWVCFFFCFSFQTRKHLALIKFYNAAVQLFLKTFRKFAGKNLWFFKMASQTAIFLSVFQTPFYGCLQTLHKKAFLWIMTLLDAKIPEPSKICLSVTAFSFLSIIKS